MLDSLLAQYGTVENCEQGKSAEVVGGGEEGSGGGNGLGESALLHFPPPNLPWSPERRQAEYGVKGDRHATGGLWPCSPDFGCGLYPWDRILLLMSKVAHF